ncbi:hypothetical protein LF41_170 [Lysobacter dokdonensis DS-58]|uniref:C4-dicarboxylate ABC transporter n=1 Tax=Lysobacter dokdonensis DS-58 TaxID=1300345 RepID=A0A0A2WFF5_9GAMM|nr:hypothetical protein [Lysobacter dokdonensis]KGQ18931.1 hypothetical protein LF41_170 [Lysobacter dokdonensis DS-58]
MTRAFFLLCLMALAGHAHARTLEADIAKIALPIGTLERVHVQLDWPADAPQGTLRLQTARLRAPGLGVDARNLAWTCPLQRTTAHGWGCEGTLHAGRQTFRLGIAFDEAGLSGTLQQGRGTMRVDRGTATPDLTRIDLTRVPIAWAQSLLSKAWADARLQGGTLDGRVDVAAPAQGPLRIGGRLTAAGAKLETVDATIAADNLAGTFDFDYRIFDAPRPSLLTLDGTLRGGEFLAGTAYIALPSTPVRLSITGESREGAGWSLPSIAWTDGEVLTVRGRAAFAEDATLRLLDVQAHSGDLAPVRDRYLSGPLGTAGLSDLTLAGALDARLHIEGGQVQAFSVVPHGVDIEDGGAHRFAFLGLDGDLRYSRTSPVESTLTWREGALWEMPFAQARLPMRSGDGAISLTDAVSVPFLGGALRFENMTLRPPSGEQGADAVFGLGVEHLDVGKLATTFGWPAFRGELTGRLPRAHYANERLDFEGGLSMAVFDGRVDVSQLSMERPFGVAPTLAADLAVEDLDLLALTEVFDFGSISGRLDGRIDALRLVDWTVTAFDADLHTDPTHTTRQRISQRAVQSISSVGDSSFVSTLQGKAIALFDDFGYKRIGIGCTLSNEVCAMRGLRSAGDSFTIVEGAGLPRLTVVGIHDNVDWPTLVERLTAVAGGEVTPEVR